ncbi:ABC transporter permease [Longimycelium tulufanense]|uniref:ABC transporter permease n=1 Tax=Longimycelium tulufanense TaxID=907463 RepID=A0A8J3CK03_9PSEU|nr:EamA family transporter [Longimycelium tulufanense]GGM79480.1 ABC transporter permease [Longimycelium tulufanense]
MTRDRVWPWVACSAAGPALFGTFYTATHHLPASPVWTSVYRVVPAAVALLVWRPVLPAGPWWRRSLILGGLNFAAFFVLQAVAAHRLPGGIVAIVIACQSMLVPVLAVALLGERVRLFQVAAAALGVMGVALLVEGATTGLDWIGLVAAAGAAFSAATGFTLTKKWGLPPHVGPVTATGWQLFGGAALLVLAAFLVEGTPPGLDAAGVLAVAWVSLGATALAFSLLFTGLHKLPSAAGVSVLALTAPLVAALLGWAAGERLSGLQWVGMAVIAGAVVAGQRAQRGRASTQDVAGAAHGVTSVRGATR